MPRQYSQEFKERGVRLLIDRLEAEPGQTPWQAMRDIASKLGIAPESLRRWYHQYQVATGVKAALTQDEHGQIKRLKRENTELRRANEILKTASAFFAAELDRPAR